MNHFTLAFRYGPAEACYIYFMINVVEHEKSSITTWPGFKSGALAFAVTRNILLDSSANGAKSFPFPNGQFTRISSHRYALFYSLMYNIGIIYAT